MLDFYLLGLGRSGTTSCCQALNLHPELYCGIERFPITQAPCSITFPDSFLDESIKGNPVGLAHAREHLSATTVLRPIRVIGDKSPKKFYCPSHLGQTGANIVIYRSYTNATASWDARANNPEDVWSNSRTGKFFFLDLLLFLNCLPFSNRLAVVNFDQLFFGDYASELKYALQALKLSADAYPFEVFEDRFFRRKNDYQKNSSRDDYDAFARHIKLDVFENSFFKLALSERHDLIKDYCDFIKANSAQFFSDFADSINPDEAEELYWATSVLHKNLTKQDYNQFYSSVHSSFKLFLDSHSRRSVNALINVVGLYPKLDAALLEISKRYFRKNQLDNALTYAQRAIAVVKKMPHHYSYYGNLLMRLGQWQAAEEAFSNALEINSDFHPAYAQLSHLHAKKKQWDKALEAINKAIDLDDTVANYHLHQSNMLAKMGYKDNVV